MEPLTITSLLLHLTLISSLLSPISAQNFLQCLTKKSVPSNIVVSPTKSSYPSILDSFATNLLFISSTAPIPQFIITPTEAPHIQSTVVCAKKHGLLIRVRSGGHDYEGLSYIAHKPFLVIDLQKFQDITIDMYENTAWVQAGATVGQVYYRIAERSSTLGFPAGVCSTIGVGGHIGGGGLGFFMRKYGLAADNVVDAQFVDVNGKLLDRKSMGEDLFWAIRGGGGASFGVIVAWKIQLVPVPPAVTVFRVARNLSQGATSLFYKWQRDAHSFPRDLLIRNFVQASGGTIRVSFESIFLGTLDELLPVMNTSFPELGIQREDCAEMSWINSTLRVAGLTGYPLEVLLNRSQRSRNYHKGKSDFVTQAIPIGDLEKIWEEMLSEDISPMMINEPWGGRVGEISESATPFPHRDGNLYNIQYYMPWRGVNETPRYLERTRRFYEFMAPYVSKAPRRAYVNYKDLDLGVNKDLNASFREASVWGEKYFNGNFARLALVKSRVDKDNFFWNEQSVVPFDPK